MSLNLFASEFFRAASRQLALIGLCTFIGLASLGAQEVYPGNESAPLTPADDGRKPFMDTADASPLPPAEGPSYIDAKGANRPSAEINAGDEVSAVPKQFQYGLRLTIRGVYDDNIFLDEFNRVDDYYFAIEPGITLGFGDIVGRNANYIRFDYAPSIFLYTDHSDANAVQHLFRFEGYYNFGRLGLTISQDVQLLDGANQGINFAGPNPVPGINLDAGGETELNIFATRANLTYDLTGKTFLSGGLHYTVYDYDTLIGTETIAGNLFINYNYSPKLVIGVGGTVGYNDADFPSPDETFEQANLRLTYQISGKVSLNASGGIEFRQFEDGGRGDDYVSGVYELGATYQPFDGTTLTARGSRRTMTSAVFVGQDYASTNIVFGARQRLLRRIYLGLAAGYENSNYFSTIDGVNATRDDDYFFVQPAIDVTLTQFWTVGAYYLHRQNDSNASGFSFYNNQFGLRTSLTY